MRFSVELHATDVIAFVAEMCLELRVLQTRSNGDELTIKFPGFNTTEWAIVPLDAYNEYLESKEKPPIIPLINTTRSS